MNRDRVIELLIGVIVQGTVGFVLGCFVGLFLLLVATGFARFLPYESIEPARDWIWGQWLPIILATAGATAIVFLQHGDRIGVRGRGRAGLRRHGRFDRYWKWHG